MLTLYPEENEPLRCAAEKNESPGQQGAREQCYRVCLDERGESLSHPCPTVISLIPLTFLLVLSEVNESETRFRSP